MFALNKDEIMEMFDDVSLENVKLNCEVEDWDVDQDNSGYEPSGQAWLKLKCSMMPIIKQIPVMLDPESIKREKDDLIIDFRGVWSQDPERWEFEGSPY